ncbi:CSMD2 [Branchiostoma lanceolatum]|uniref:CSMD2 protein n=1 Tax=Branchiostoma lanceolatum TaxID=7740 RepID=A0A8J9Z7T1_BRALA|nr:CSMD2 [Branchiostoma lanceolatum]
MNFGPILLLFVIFTLHLPESSGFVRINLNVRRRRCPRRNCQLGNWGSWSSNCYGTCSGSGEQTRVRSISVSARCGGSQCSGPSTDVKPCTGNCNNHGSWGSTGGSCLCNSGYTGTCCQTVIRCSSLDTPRNGGMSSYDNDYGSTVNFWCNDGYQLTGSSTRTCQGDRRWSGTTPYCDKVSCPALSSPANGFVTVGGSFYRDTASYSCFPGYDLVGSSTRTCQADKLWSGTAPTCVGRHCTPLSAPANGSVIGGNLYGDHVTFSCNTGFQLSNNDIRICGHDGVWSGVQPTCEVVECNEPNKIPHSDITVSGVKFGDTINSSCHPGYYLVGGDTVRTCQADGEWSGNPHSCQEMCCLQPSVPYGNYNGAVCYNETISLQCYEGHYLTSSYSELTCTERGSWDKPIPQCDSICCNSSISVKNGYLTAPSGYCFGSTVQIHCDRGYEVSGESSILFCNASGVWEGEKPTCERVTCKDPGEIRNGQRNLTGLSYGDTVTYVCDSGFIMVGNDTSTCDEFGDWGPTRFCKANSLCNRTRLLVPTQGSKICFDSPQGAKPVEYCQMHCNAPREYNRNDGMYECSEDTSWLWQVRVFLGSVGATYNIVPVGECSMPWFPSADIHMSNLVITTGQPFDTQAIEDEMRHQLTHLGLCNTPCEIGAITVEVDTTRRLQDTQYQISIQFRTYADPALITPTNTIQMELVHLAGEVRQKIMQLQTLIQSGGLVLSIGGQTLPVADGGIIISNPTLGCKDGQIKRGNNCFPCGPGTYHDTLDGFCRACEYASYQDESGQTKCKPCPDETTTEGAGSKNISDCKVFDDCNCGSNPCILSATGYFCYCLRGYKLANGTCVDIDECEDPGICPNARCINRPGSYSCQCLPGYDGPVCADIDECRYSGYCPEHSTCTNTDGNYFCTCKQGYQGDNCEDCIVFHGKCYIVSDAMVTFAEAEMKCAEQGGIHVTIRDQHTQDFLVQLLSVSNKDVWIGLTDRDVEGQFIWTDGTPLVYSNWAPGEPNGDDTKNCVHLWPLANFRWDDESCARSNYYICQYNIS